MCNTNAGKQKCRLKKSIKMSATKSLDTVEEKKKNFIRMKLFLLKLRTQNVGIFTVYTLYVHLYMCYMFTYIYTICSLIYVLYVHYMITYIYTI